MGTTSEKLTYLNTTKGLIKDKLNLGGANITTEPFRQYSSKLMGIYKDFLANGTDTLWNNWEKVSGSGETLTLNNTMEGKMKVDLKGNTSQESTTGKNLYAFGDLSISSNYYFENKKLLENYENNTTYTLSFDINSSITPFKCSVGYGNDTYSVDGYTIDNQTNGHITLTFTTNRGDYSNLWIRIPRFGSSGTQWTATI